jgi:hypothetical protein
LDLATAAADEFQMFDALFTSMSPIFPFLDLPMDPISETDNSNINAVTDVNSNLNLHANSDPILYLNQSVPFQPTSSGNGIANVDMGADPLTQHQIPPRPRAMALSPLEQFVSEHEGRNNRLQSQSQNHNQGQSLISPWPTSTYPQATSSSSMTPAIRADTTAYGDNGGAENTAISNSEAFIFDTNTSGNGPQISGQGEALPNSSAQTRAEGGAGDMKGSLLARGLSASEVYRSVVKP